MKYLVTAECITYLTLEVEANCLDEAYGKAEETDGSYYSEEPFSDWRIIQVTEETYY